MYASASDYFRECALPLYRRYMSDHGTDLRWAAVAAVHHIVDYYVLEKTPNAGRDDLQMAALKFRQQEKLEQLGRIADAFKHGMKIEKTKIVASANSLAMMPALPTPA